MVDVQMAVGMESFVAPLVIAILTALTVFAYRYPNGYPAAAVIACFFLLVSGLAFLVWNFGVSVASRGALDFVPFENHDQIRAVEDQLSMSDDILIGLLAVFAYVCVLLWVPGHRITESGRKNEQDE
jgi:hypothetical protein